VKLTRFLPLALLSILLLLAACALPATRTIEDNATISSDEASETANETDNETDNETAAETAAAESIVSAIKEDSEGDAEEDAAETTNASRLIVAASEMAPFIIDPAQSEARFALDEDLRGTRVTVVGVTSALSGEIMIDPATPVNTQIGPITIDAATFVTDSDRRNGAIRRFVLNTDSYPTITFVPTALNGLPDSIAVGDTISFEIQGDLTLTDQTRAETFNITVTVDSESQISGSATSEIAYADYGIFVPDVPFVANVEDELDLTLDFVAIK